MVEKSGINFSSNIKVVYIFSEHRVIGRGFFTVYVHGAGHANHRPTRALRPVKLERFDFDVSIFDCRIVL